MYCGSLGTGLGNVQCKIEEERRADLGLWLGLDGNIMA